MRIIELETSPCVSNKINEREKENGTACDEVRALAQKSLDLSPGHAWEAAVTSQSPESPRVQRCFSLFTFPRDFRNPAHLVT